LIQSRLTKNFLADIIIIGIACIIVSCVLLLQHQSHTMIKNNASVARLSTSTINNVLAENTSIQNNIAYKIFSPESSLLSDKNIKHAMVYNANGTVVLSTRSKDIGTSAYGQEIDYIKKAEQVLSTSDTAFVRVSRADRMVYVYSPFQAQDGLVYITRLDATLGTMGKALREIYILLSVFIFILCVLFIVLGRLVIKKIITPIRLLSIAAKEMHTHDDNLRIHIKSQDEIAELADTITAMSIASKTNKT
jgi:nitrate/nitrite-specific signal transduction histidine kinase